MPEISVIVPVYNVEKYIHRCVDSILTQTFSDFELLLVDDGSPDNCPAICDKYAVQDDRVRVIHQNNGGLSAARNAGLDKAQGKYFFFVDSDDLICQGSLQLLFGYAEKTSAKVVGGGLTRFAGVSPEETTFSWENVKWICRNNIETLSCFFDKEITQYNLVSVCGKLFHKELFEGLRFPVGRLFEDEYVIYQLYYRADKIAFADAALYYYYINESGITRNLTIQKRFDEYDAQWERLEFFGEKGLNDLHDKALMAFLRTAQWDLIACRENRESVEEERKRRFEQQYETVFEKAQKRNILEFIRDYDYYVLAKPKLTLWWRIKRQLVTAF